MERLEHNGRDETDMRLLPGKTEERRPLWEPRHKLNYNIKMYLKKTEWRDCGLG